MNNDLKETKLVDSTIGTFFDHYIEMAEREEEQSKCRKKKVNAVIILTTGEFITAVNYTENCDKLGCARKDMKSGENKHLCRAIHAEQNALAIAARYGMRVDNAQMLINEAPCLWCARLIALSGIKEVVFKRQKNMDTDFIEFLIKHDVRVIEVR